MPTGKETSPHIIQACRKEYLEGKGIIKEIALKYGVKTGTLQAIATRQGWHQIQTNIGKEKELLVSVVQDRAMSKAADKAADRVGKHLEEVFSASSSFMAKLRENMEKSMSLPPTLDAQTALQVITAYGKADSLTRRALNLPDSVQAVDITTGGEALHSRSLQILESCRKLVSDGKTVEIDVEGLRSKMLESK